MKESFWAMMVVGLGIVSILFIYYFQSVTNTSEHNYELVKDSSIEFIKFNSVDGYRIYSRTLKMVLYMALTKLYSTTDVEFIATINKDQFFEIIN